ncbi:farnesyl pyrophosphate synthase-like [Lutzomyia longipalpis]|uniref:farnesyl pyrophosphate synthase-like n=1 Tax=Lutzomyia longipalpis TaxID=7200 RepID=UPI00248336C3|nr:farnesyl pyrophosphate synthase-like [Lutzomyia longipalpis]
MKAIAENCKSYGTGTHIERLLNYSVYGGGKKNRCQIVVDAFEELAPQAALTEANRALSAFLGWCHEVFHGMYIIMDDIMDASTTRRRKPCWYKLDDVQMTAINDGLLLQGIVYEVLKKKFGSMQNYGSLTEVFHRNLLFSTIGENMDLATMHQDVLTFTMEQVRHIAAYKTAHHSFYTPTELAFNLTGNTNLQILEQAKNILYEIGIFFQVQDDFLDCYGDPAVTGKEGTDIQDKKCTWLVATFLERANAAQKKTLKESYGKKDEKSVQIVKQLYTDVGLPEIYKTYEEATYKRIKEDIQQAKGIPQRLCQNLMDKLYKRKF